MPEVDTLQLADGRPPASRVPLTPAPNLPRTPAGQTPPPGMGQDSSPAEPAARALLADLEGEEAAAPLPPDAAASPAGPPASEVGTDGFTPPAAMPQQPARSLPRMRPQGLRTVPGITAPQRPGSKELPLPDAAIAPSVRARGADVRVRLALTLDEAIAGADKEVEDTRTERCQVCDGDGSQPGSRPERCPVCLGTGRSRRGGASADDEGAPGICPECNGRGQIITRPCRGCGGTGASPQTRRVRIDVPPGTGEGAELLAAGAGDQSLSGGLPGDLYVVVSIAPHPVFERDGDDLVYELQLGPGEAEFGTEVSVPTLDGDVSLRIPPGTGDGAELTLPGHGVPRAQGGRGDQRMRVSIWNPSGEVPPAPAEEAHEPPSEPPPPAKGTSGPSSGAISSVTIARASLTLAVVVLVLVVLLLLAR